MKLMTAAEMNDVSNDNYKVLEEQALEGFAFKRLVNQIEDAAMDGYKCTIFELKPDEDERIPKIFNKYLEDAGYKSEVGMAQRPNIYIRWGEKE